MAETLIGITCVVAIALFGLMMALGGNMKNMDF